MNVWKKSLLVGGCVAALTLFSAVSANAQGRFDPAQMRQDRMDRFKDAASIKDEDWKAIEPLVGKVIDSQMDLFRGGGRGGFGRRNRGGDNGTNSAGASASEERPRRGGFGGEPSEAMQALQKAVEANAPAAELKPKIAAVRAENKAKEDKYRAAQEELRGVLTAKQEAVAMTTGLLR